jgi:hypothetical protein
VRRTGQTQLVLCYEAAADDLDSQLAWELYARPERWHEWAPHLRGAWGLAGPGGEVAPGRRGAVRLLGALPVPATITAKDPGRSWTWRVGGVVTMEHQVAPGRVALELRAPMPLERALGAAYGPVIGLLLQRLSRSARARPRPTGTGSPRG